jgi:glycosyltransferase involved in cell wall biosynthesis
MADNVPTYTTEEHRQPSVSIVIPVQPPAPGLASVIERLLVQRYDGTIEVLVVIDDGGEIPEVPAPPSLSGTLRRALRTLYNARECGLEGARRTGREAAEGEIVVYCDQAEEWGPDRLREAVLRRFVARPHQPVRDPANH